MPPLAKPGEVVDAWSNTVDTQNVAVVIRTRNMEVVRLYVASGARVPTHEAQGELTVLCIQGRVAVTAAQERHELYTGQLLFLLVNEPFTIHGIENSSLLITFLTPTDGIPTPLIGGAEASEATTPPAAR